MGYSPMELALSFIKAGELTDALEALDGYLAGLPVDDAAYRLRANILARSLERDQLLGALEDLGRVGQPESADWLLQSVIYERLGSLGAALERAEQAQGLFPLDERVTERVLYLLRESGQLAAARERVAEQLGRSDNWRWQQWAGDLAAADGDDEAAVGFYGAALEQIDGQYAIPLDGAARIARQDGISEAAALTIAGVYARLRLARAESLGRLGQLVDALADYEVAERLIPDDPGIGFNRGVIRWRAGDEAAAAECVAAFARASAGMQEHWRVALGASARDRELLARLVGEG